MRNLRVFHKSQSWQRLLWPLVALGALLLAGCGAAAGNEGAAADGRLQVVATTGQVADLVRNVGGDHVTVTALMGPGVDPHLFVASEGDVERLQQADMIVYNGLFLEAQMADIFEQLGARKPTIPVGDRIDPGRLLPWAQYADEFDPHIWFDVSLWMAAVATVRDALVEADAANAAAYEANAATYLATLQQLDDEIKQAVARIPAEQRVLITAHDAFHYFGRAYGFEVRGLQGISTASEASTADVRTLADFIVARQIPAIFVESSVPVRNVEALQAAVADRGFEVSIGGELYSDALGSPDGDAGTYVGMVRHNVATMVGALVGGE